MGVSGHCGASMGLCVGMVNNPIWWHGVTLKTSSLWVHTYHICSLGHPNKAVPWMAVSAMQAIEHIDQQLCLGLHSTSFLDRAIHYCANGFLRVNP